MRGEKLLLLLLHDDDPIVRRHSTRSHCTCFASSRAQPRRSFIFCAVSVCARPRKRRRTQSFSSRAAHCALFLRFLYRVCLSFFSFSVFRNPFSRLVFFGENEKGARGASSRDACIFVYTESQGIPAVFARRRLEVGEMSQ